MNDLTSGTRTYKYDIAFSFLAQDEPLAEQLNSLLGDRFTTFLYSKAQERVAGTDGELTFGTVFEAEARLVAVLFRAGWGETAWTRIEQTAIRNRGYEEGYDFATLVNLDKSAPPRWLPKARIWVDVDRYGIEAVAAILEARIAEAGGEPGDNSALGQARRMEVQRRQASERAVLLHSENGVKLANAEFLQLAAEIRRVCDQLQAAGHEQIQIRTSNDGCLLYLRGVSLSLAWQLQWANVLDHSTLHLMLWRGTVDTDFGAKRADLRSHREFDFDVLANKEPRWRERPTGGRAWSSAQLADDCVKVLLREVESLENDRDPHLPF